MADDRADPIIGSYDAEAEEHILGIINGDIPYVPAEEDEEEDVSSYLNLDGEGEGHQQGDDERTDTVSQDMQLATTSGEVYIYIEPLVIQIYRFE